MSTRFPVPDIRTSWAILSHQLALPTGCTRKVWPLPFAEDFLLVRRSLACALLTAAVQRGIQRHSPFLIAFTANWTFFADAGFQTSRNARSSSWPRRLHRILQSTSGTVSPPVPKHKLTHTRGDSAGTAARDARVHPPHASDDEGVQGRGHGPPPYS